MVVNCIKNMDEDISKICFFSNKYSMEEIEYLMKKLY